MKQDKHKAKRSARYNKKHNGIPTGKSANKTEKATESAPPKDHQRKPEHGNPTIIGDGRTALLIEKQAEMHKEYSRRKIVSNWTKYEDFSVDDHQETEVYSKPRGEDFQKLVSKSDDSASQLRMKDEVWWEDDDEEDESETEIGKLFKVDFDDVARRLEAIPVHERLGIPAKYFEEDLLAKINEDAAEHARLYQELLDSEQAQNLYNPALSDITRDHTSRGLSDPTPSACELDRLQGETDLNSHEQMCDDTYTSKTYSDKENCSMDSKQNKSQASDVRTPDTAASDNSCSHLNLSTTSGDLVISSNETTLSADVNEPSSKPHTQPEEEENLEEWLDDVLDD